MQALVTNLNAWSADWSQFMLAVLWQSTLLAAAIGVIAWLARRASPAVRYWLWQIVAIKLLLAPIWTLGLPLAWLPSNEPVQKVANDVNSNAQPSAIERTFENDGAIVANDGPLLPLASDPEDDTAKSAVRSPNSKRVGKTAVAASLGWMAWLMIAWGTLVACQSLLLAWQRVRLGRLLAQCEFAGPPLQQVVRDVAESIQLRRVPTVRLSDVDCSPFVCGLLRPTLVLPKALEPLVSAGELRPVIVHELAHLKRGDLWFGWAPQIAKVVYFFHPVAHWAAFRVRLEAELACDGWAMNATGQGPAAYADLLVRVVSRLSEPAMLRPATAALDGQAKMEKRNSRSSDLER
jgi:beta-lactamase regulating signal transducer with metallopeptidase domain